MADQAVKISTLTALLLAFVLGAGEPSFAQITKAEQADSLIDEAGSATAKQAASTELISRPVLEYKSEAERDPFLDYLPEKQEPQAQGEVKEDFANKLKGLAV